MERQDTQLKAKEFKNANETLHLIKSNYILERKIEQNRMSTIEDPAS